MYVVNLAIQGLLLLAGFHGPSTIARLSPRGGLGLLACIICGLAGRQNKKKLARVAEELPLSTYICPQEAQKAFIFT